MFAACAGGKSSVPNPSSASAPHSTLGRLRVINGHVEGINDAPRRPNSERFEARKAAAHARGRWLTDELNLPKHLVAYPNSATLLNQINSSADGGRSTSAVQQACDTCDPSGSGGAQTPTISSFDDNGGYGPYDTEIDYTDGTSLLTKEWVDSVDGTLVLTFIDQRGMYSILASFVGGTGSGSGHPTPTPTSTPGNQYCYPMDGGYISCGGQPMNPIPKWACPYVGGLASLATGWFIQGKKGQVAALLIGGSVTTWCTNTGW
jgi:hypothetical protein